VKTPRIYAEEVQKKERNPTATKQSKNPKIQTKRIAGFQFLPHLVPICRHTNKIIAWVSLPFRLSNWNTL
jgi:hypothetical protein